jgi:hypothetical protein
MTTIKKFHPKTLLTLCLVALVFAATDNNAHAAQPPLVTIGCQVTDSGICQTDQNSPCSEWGKKIWGDNTFAGCVPTYIGTGIFKKLTNCDCTPQTGTYEK